MPNDSGEDKRVTFRMPVEDVNEFDDKIIQLKASGELDRDVSRSEVIRMLMEAWVSGNSMRTSNRAEPLTATVS